MQKIELNAKTKLNAIKDIKQFFWDERSENISDFHAAIILDFLINNIGPYIYNQAISDAYKFMSEKVEDLYGLEKRRFSDISS